MDEQQFKTEADNALNSLYKKLATASGEAPFETDFNSGALAIEFEDPPTKFIISPNSPVRQIWVSAQSRSFKLNWNPTSRTFVLPDSGQSLNELIQHVVSEQLGEKIVL